MNHPPSRRMRTLAVILTLASALAARTQNTIYSHAVGNWRDGPVVLITPLIETTEAFTTQQLLVRYRGEFPELKDVEDIDVLRFATVEEGEQSRTTLKAKYEARSLEVKMLQALPVRDAPLHLEHHE